MSARREESVIEQERIERFIADHIGRVLISGGIAYILQPITCSVAGCRSLASQLDRFAPYHMEYTLCKKHRQVCEARPPRGGGTRS